MSVDLARSTTEIAIVCLRVTLCSRGSSAKDVIRSHQACQRDFFAAVSNGPYREVSCFQMSRAHALTPQQEDAIWAAYLRKVPRQQIAQEVGTSPTTVSAVVQRVKQRLNDRRTADLEALRTDALAEYDQLQREAWDRLQQCSPTSTLSVGYLGVILDARRQEDRILGLQAPKAIDVTSGGESIGELIKQLLHEPVNIIDLTPNPHEIEDIG
jgi:hypothetical protein